MPTLVTLFVVRTFERRHVLSCLCAGRSKCGSALLYPIVIPSMIVGILGIDFCARSVFGLEFGGQYAGTAVSIVDAAG